MMEDDADAVWLYTACGLIRVARPELDAWAAHAKQTIQASVFDSFDGVSNRSDMTGPSPMAAKSTDGRLWFVGSGGVSVLDPHHLHENRLLPPVHIEKITADGQTYDAAQGLRLPPLIRDLTIDYTALSFVAPEKNHFRVRLEGQDANWREVVNDRHVQYSNLAPRRYRFRVTASNNSGVWNETGATLDFSIAPAYYQTRWFQAAMVVAAIALLWIAYELRIRQLAHQFNRTLDARVSERTRIARDLHDTLLQSLQGLLLRFQAASNFLPARPAEAKERLDAALDQAEAAIAEGRDTVRGLRTSAVTVNDLANGIVTAAAALTGDPPAVDAPKIVVEIDGASRDLNPVVREEAYRIACEAMRNAFKHAQARQIVVTICYEARQLRLTIHDDGTGMDEETMRRQQAPGHFGLPGMRERAAIVRGRLEVRSAVDVGTEIDLRVPGGIAYRTPARWWWLRVFERGDGHA
jgi:signal transduction histidine kinase